MRFERFELERIQSEWEHRVKYNLAESGVKALRLCDILMTQIYNVNSLSKIWGIHRQTARFR